MELVKFTPEEQAKIDADRASGFVVLVVKAPILFHIAAQVSAAEMIASELEILKKRAERAKMIILDRNVFANLVDSGTIVGMVLVVTIIGQWATIDAIEEMNRRRQISGVDMPRGRA